MLVKLPINGLYVMKTIQVPFVIERKISNDLVEDKTKRDQFLVNSGQLAEELDLNSLGQFLSCHLFRTT